MRAAAQLLSAVLVLALAAPARGDEWDDIEDSDGAQDAARVEPRLDASDFREPPPPPPPPPPMETALRRVKWGRGAQAELQRRDAFSGPVLVTGLLAKNRVLGSVRNWSPSQFARSFSTLKGLKVGGRRTFSYWHPPIASGDGRQLAGLVGKGPHAQHWKLVPPTSTKEVLAAEREKRGAVKAPFNYWAGKARLSAGGKDGKPVRVKHEMCERLAQADSVDDCTDALGTEQGTSMEQFWLSSHGVTAQLHYDLEDNFLVGVHGRKKVTLFPPSALGSVCLHPAVHPSNRQSQADVGPALAASFGGAADAKCPSFSDAKNTQQAISLVLHPGDVLLLPCYWLHHIEAVAPSEISISYNVWYRSPHRVAHEKMHDVMRRSWTSEVQSFASTDAEVQAACRLLLRAVLEAAFPDAVSWQRAVQRGWQQRWAPLRAAWPRAKTRKLCQRERKLRKANERAVVALRRTGEEMAFAFGSLPMEVRDVEAFDLVDSTIGMLHSNSLLSVQQTHGFVQALTACAEQTL